MQRTIDLPAMLRRETADLHRQVEDDVGLPVAVRSRADYVALLQRLHGFHAMVEHSWDEPQWRREWAALDIDLSRHRRTPQLMEDLTTMGERASLGQARPLEMRNFGEVLGSLYVVEGSALGGQVLAPMLRRSAGAVPTSFFDSAGRDHPKPWRAVKAALCAFESHGGDNSPVIEGARATFEAFGSHVARAEWSAPR